ncbi:hypothetical protein EDB89DRAFT_2050228 [Lactarius sanguifluus]|nr:hypothetical protein EDB89DRAFT_2050228 [Lactarius sanguifluus]
MTAGFELNVLRGKQPYRWTIWIYLGTRYSCLLMFIVFFIHNDSGHVPCQPFIIANYALSYASWAFASLIIVLRIIAIWDRNIVVSLIAVSTLLAGLGLNIRTLTKVRGVLSLTPTSDTIPSSDTSNFLPVPRPITIKFDIQCLVSVINTLQPFFTAKSKTGGPLSNYG